MLLDPAQYAASSISGLLEAAARGHIGLDHRFLKAILERGDSAAPEIVSFALAARDQDRLDLDEDLIAVFRHLKSPQAIPFLIDRLRRDDCTVSDELLDAFLQFPAESVEPLLALRQEVGPDGEGDTPFLLASLGVRDERILKVLLEQLARDPDEAAMNLGLYGDPAARPELERALGALDPADTESRWARRSIETAIADLERRPAAGHEERFDIWELYPEVAHPRFDLLSFKERVEFMASPLAEYRAAAADSFFNEELIPPVRDRLLETARGDADVHVRARAWRSLGGAIEQDAVRGALLARLEDPSAPAEERAGALVGLATEAADEPVRKHVLELYGDPSTRAMALETMWRSLDRTFASYFPPHLEDPDPEVRRSAILGAGYLGLYGEADHLRQFFDEDDFRSEALFAYALAVRAEISRGRMRALLRRIDATAGGLSLGETELVREALDERLMLHGLAPVFEAEEEEVPQNEEDTPTTAPSRIGRNEPCPCGSGKKYKRCCGA